MNVAHALRAATARLSENSDTARLDAELLMAHALGASRSAMLLHHQHDPVPAGFSALIKRRTAREPVAHIIGSQEFYGRPFTVTRDTLIPRGDTELLIDVALELQPEPARILDMGTGTGALAITMLAETDCVGVATDRSSAALNVARENARAHGVAKRLALIEADWNATDWAADLGAFDLILCNPPYVEEDAPLDPDVGEYEPAEALFSGPEGLDDYRVIVPQLGKLLVRDGLALLEIGASQGPAIREIGTASGFEVAIRTDLSGRDRCAVLS